MLGFAMGLPEQVEEAAGIGRAFRPPAGYRRPAQVVLAGMGGSAMAGDFLAQLCLKRTPIPFSVCREYELPAFVGPRTLFLASSHSGDTEEALASAEEARRRGARIICITTGGKLSAFAQRHRLPLIVLPQTEPKMPPRAAMGYSLIPLVCALDSLGLYPDADGEIAEAEAVMRALRDRLRPTAGKSRNPAKQLAGDLYGKIPWIQGTAGIMSAAAYRWRTQFNENSKVLAYSSEYPEMNHNETVGWEAPAEMALRTEVVVLERPDDYYRVRARVRITASMIRRKTRVHLVKAEGRSPLAQLLSTVYLGDFTSLYLAFLNGVDPAAIGPIEKLKRSLAKLPVRQAQGGPWRA
jgi:glucose/mannose-6-phosphate isomerase